VDLERLETLELVESVAVVALDGVDDALEAGEGLIADAEDLAERGVVAEIGEAIHLVVPDLGFGRGETAEGPGGAHHDIDEVALLGVGGVEALVVFAGEGVELGAVLTGDNERLGVDTGFHGIHAGAGLALGGARARGGVWRLHKGPLK
jgi:hypothetical protein